MKRNVYRSSRRFDVPGHSQRKQEAKLRRAVDRKPIAELYCGGCERNTNARLTTGREVYPNRPELHLLPLWICDACRNYVGCHHKTDDFTRPLGSIPSKQVRAMRTRLHAIIDPMWKSGRMSRVELYQRLSQWFGRSFHVAELNTVEECSQAIAFCKRIRDGKY